MTALPCGSARRIAENVELGPIPADVWYVSRDGVANVVSTSRTVAEPGGLGTSGSGLAHDRLQPAVRAAPYPDEPERATPCLRDQYTRESRLLDARIRGLRIFELFSECRSSTSMAMDRKRLVDPEPRCSVVASTVRSGQTVYPARQSDRTFGSLRGSRIRFDL